MSGEQVTVTNVLPLLFETHFQTILNGIDPTQISLKNFDTQGKLVFTNLTVPEITTYTYYDEEQNISEPTVTPSRSSSTIAGIDYKYIDFVYSSGAQHTSYSINFPENTQCDILVVGSRG